MTNEKPNLRAHIRRRKNGKVVTYYFYDRRGQDEKDIPLGTNYEAALIKWKEIHEDGPRIYGTIEEGFKEWEKDKDEGLPSYTNAETRRGYAKSLKKLRPSFGAATWEGIELHDLTTYLRVRTAKTQGNREMALFSIIWNYARKKGITTLPWPAAGMERSKWKNKETPIRFKVTADIFDAIYQAGDQVLRDCMDASSATGMRLTDVIGVVLPANDVLTLKASKTGKDADFDISLSTVLPELVRRRRALRADHLMLLSTPTGKPVTLRMLDARWTFAREFAAVNCEQAGEAELAKAIRATKLRYMRKYAGDLAGSDEDAQRLLQHSSITTTRAHYRTAVANLKPVR